MQELAAGVQRLMPGDYRRMRWKNARGWTTELAVHPRDAQLDGQPFEWRVSLAEVESDGEFSAFPGYDRTILLVQGGGMELSFAEAPSQRIAQPFQPFSFKGEWRTRCHLLNGAVRDFNVISRRTLFTQRFAILRPGDFPQPLADEGQVRLVYVFRGAVTLVSTVFPPATLAAGQALRVENDNPAGRFQLNCEAAGTVAVLIAFAAVTGASAENSGMRYRSVLPDDPGFPTA
ncbi:MAG TPA: HutD family protein [Gammaproteobacteria bacterium]|nr:HutD family protein [Gammaproteobacteria bacterium]